MKNDEAIKKFMMTANIKQTNISNNLFCYEVSP